MVHARFEPDQCQGLLRAHRPLGNLRDERHVLLRRKARDQIVELKHKAHVAPAIGRETAVIEPGQLQISEEQVPAGGVIEPSHDVQQRRLAAAGRAEQDHHFSSPNLEIEALQREHLNLARRVGLGQVFRGEDGVGHGCRGNCRLIGVSRGLCRALRR